jgi:hypothetical protein
VTSGPVNPSSTISALSLRAAEHLLQRRADLPLPARRVFVAAAAAATARPAPIAVVAFAAAARARLKQLAGAIIPATEEMPSAADIGLENAPLDRILTARPDLAADLARAVDGDLTDAGARLRELISDDPAAYQALLTVVAAGYYLDSEIRARIGYPGQVPRPLKADLYPPYVAEGLLDHLVNA